MNLLVHFAGKKLETHAPGSPREQTKVRRGDYSGLFALRNHKMKRHQNARLKVAKHGLVTLKRIPNNEHSVLPEFQSEALLEFAMKWNFREDEEARASDQMAHRVQALCEGKP